MAISTIRGPGASVTMPSGFNGKYNNISATINIPDTDTFGFTDNGYSTFEPVGPVSVSYTVSGHTQFDATTTAPVSSTLLASTVALASGSGSITLTFQTGCSLGFTGTVNSVALNRPAGNSAMTTSQSGNSNGAITLTWDETA